MERREIHGHETKNNPVAVRILAMDRPDDSGASHQYRFERDDGCVMGVLNFHVGEIEVFSGKDVNGVTMEAVIMAMIDRLKGFQTGTEKHKQYDFTRKRLEEALKALQTRTEELAENNAVA